MTLGPYSQFGEIAALKGSRRAASVISNAFTELLVLTRCSVLNCNSAANAECRHDLLNKVDSSTRKKLEEHSESYRNDKELLDDLIEGLKWEKYKSDLVRSILVERKKECYLVQRAGDKEIPSWRP